MARIYPVILRVPDTERHHKGRDLVTFLSRHARRALTISAQKYGVPLPPGWPVKDANGVPVAREGLFWSISHKPEYVAGVISPEPVGIDIEKIRPFREGLQCKVAAEEEWALSGDIRPGLLFRFWTAKEAVLKATGEGLKGLSHCRISRIADDRHLHIDFRNQMWPVELCCFENHVAAVTAGDSTIEWILADEEETRQ